MRSNIDKKYRIVKVTFGDKSDKFILEKKNWLGKWSNAFPMTGMAFNTIEDAEKAYAYISVDPIATVIKELA